VIYDATNAINTLGVAILGIVGSIGVELLIIPLILAVPLLWYFYTELFIFITYWYISIWSVVLNICINLYNVLSGYILPVVYVILNLFNVWIRAAFTGIYMAACPNGYHGDFNRDCEPMVTALGQGVAFIQNVIEVIQILFTSLAGMMSEIQEMICDPQNNLAICSGNAQGQVPWGSSLHDKLEGVDHGRRIFVHAITGDSNSGSTKIIIAIVTDIVTILIKSFFPFCLQLGAVLLDLLTLFIKLAVGLGGGLVHMVIQMFSAVLDKTYFNDTSYPDKTTQNAQYQAFIVNYVLNLSNKPENTFIQKAPGPRESRIVLAGFVQFISDTVVFIYKLFFEMLQMSDKGLCITVNLPSCVGYSSCSALFGKYLKGYLILPIINLDLSPLFLQACGTVWGTKECPCEKCSLQPDALFYNILGGLFRHVPCNPRQIDPGTGLVCCIDASLILITARLFGGI
jgi:hypothetical protein